MDFVFDQLDTTTCAGCGGSVDVAGLPAFKVIVCPHCNGDVRVPGKLGTLLLQEVVGVGSAGIVYKALDVTLHRNVAVKILKNEEGDDKKIVQATVAEARALAAINHPNVVHIHTIGMRHGQPFIVMELLVGSGKLNVMLKEGWVADEKRGLEIALDVAQGLKAAQGAGLLHRDVKPGNILFNNEGVAKLLDFSVVHAATGDGEKVVIGTPYYISPEAARGNEVDFRADIYSLGATVFHLMTGRPVFDGESSRDVMRARLKQRAPDLREFKPNVSAMTAGTLARMLETDPADRYGSYEELIADLKLAIDQLAHGESADVGGISDFEAVVAASEEMREAAPIPVATPRRSRTLPPPVEKKSSAGLMIGLVAASIAVVVGLIFVFAGGGGDKDGKKKDGDRIASNDPPTPATDSGATKITPPSTDGEKVSPPDPDPTKDEKKTDPPVTPVTPDPPVTPVTPVQPEPPKVDPLAEAMKAWEAKVAAQLKQTPTAWQAAKFAAMRSVGGATLTQQADGSVMVTGTNPPIDTYVLEIKLDGPPEQVTGLLLEALPDASLTAGGPGRATNGNFVLGTVAAEVAPASSPRAVRTVVFDVPTADFEQASFGVAGTIDGNAQSGWATLPRVGVPNAALFPVKQIAAGGGSGTSRPTIVFDNFEAAKFADKWTVTGAAFKDRPFKDGEIVMPNLSGFEGQHMVNSALGTGLGVSNPDNKRGTGTLASKPFKIERDVITFLLAGGDKETTRVQLKVDGNVVHKASGDRSLKLKKTTWDVRAYAGKDAVLEIIDEEEKDNRGFILVDQIEFSDDAGGAVAEKNEHILRLTLAHSPMHTNHTLGKFRVSLTTAKDPFLQPQLPDNIKSIILAGAQGRTTENVKELEAFYRRTKMDGLPYIPPGGVAHTPKPVTPVTPVTPANTEPAPKLDPYKPVELAKLPDKRVYDSGNDSIVLVPRNAQWVYWAKAQTPDAKWTAADFVAGGWALDDAPFGYGGYEARTVLKDMKGKFAQLYARAPFEIEDPAKVGELTLIGRFDDAAIVYLNGQLIYRSQGISGNGSSAKVGVPVTRSAIQKVPLKDAKKHLKAGVNVLAIECHNAAADDADFILDPALISDAPTLPKQAVTTGKQDGWQVHDGGMSIDGQGLYIETAGNDPRIECTALKTDFLDRHGTVKLVLKIKVETAGLLRLDWKSKPKNGLVDLIYSEQANVTPSAQVKQVVIDKLKVQGKLTNFTIRLPKGTTLIQSIHLLDEKDNKVREAWVFGKD